MWGGGSADPLDPPLVPPLVPDLDFNITWVLPVDPGSTYFVRVHFCDIVCTSLNTLLFNLYINSKNAYSDLDLSSLTRSLDVSFYKDFSCKSSDFLRFYSASIEEIILIWRII
ncbi:putative non-specific serine/threonine protein kinase [Helianthus annuus]|nr:putative non-specific serine/threonine protein kinase [Helianthus annuus]